MEPIIIKTKALREIQTKEQCSIAESWSSEQVSIAKARVKPETTTSPHSLEGVDEIYLIAKGKGRVTLGNLCPTEVTVGDMVFIPAGTRQQITNAGKRDLVFYCICTPRFRQECYRDKTSKPKETREQKFYGSV